MPILREGRHLCDVPSAWAHNAGARWQCEECGRIWKRTGVHPSWDQTGEHATWRPLFFQIRRAR